MGKNVGTSHVDERGRVTLPQQDREAAGFAPGTTVRIENVGGGLLLRRTISVEEFIEDLEGCITTPLPKGRRTVTPEEIKGIWGAFHDHD